MIDLFVAHDHRGAWGLYLIVGRHLVSFSKGASQRWPSFKGGRQHYARDGAP